MAPPERRAISSRDSIWLNLAGNEQEAKDDALNKPSPSVQEDEKQKEPADHVFKSDVEINSPVHFTGDSVVDPSETNILHRQVHGPDLSSDTDHWSSTINPQSHGNNTDLETPKNRINESVYLDPTPTTPRLSTKSSQVFSEDQSPRNGEMGSHEPNTSDGIAEEGTTSEIQSIIDQFDGGDQAHHEDDVLSPRLEFKNSILGGSVQHPPRKSSLEPVGSPGPPSFGGQKEGDAPASSARNLPSLHTISPDQAHGNTPAGQSHSTPQSARFAPDHVNDTASTHSSISGPRLQPPEPDPEVPFDFHRFLEQLRHRTADPVAKFLRSFLVEFGKKQWMVHEQVKIISDFLTFITGKMSQCDIWRGVSDAEFDNAKEGMEKLVMNRLYSQTFSPAIPPPAPPQGGKGRKKNIEKLLGPGRKGQHQEDIERDEILGQKVRIYRWVQEEHLDIPPLGDNGRRFMSFAQQQLLKIKMYRAPRDKVVCVLNCCKVIFGFLSTSKSSDTSADSFVPLLIYVVLQANPEHLVSNVQYILRFRDQEKLGGEAGYYLSSLMGAIQFIENLDRTSLTISDDDFEKKVEASVSEIAERHEEGESLAPAPAPAPPPRPTHISEKSGLSEPEIVPRHSTEAEYNTPSRPMSSRGSIVRHSGNNNHEDSSAVTGLLRTIQKPLSSIGRMFSDDTPTGQYPGSRGQIEQPLSPSSPLRLSPAVFQPPRHSSEEPRPTQGLDPNQPQRMSVEDAAARQASAEAAEAHRIQRIEHQDVVDTLAGMFPDLDREIIDDVVREKQGRRLAPLTEEGRIGHLQDYGTMDSANYPTSEEPESSQEAETCIVSRNRGLVYFIGFYTIISLIITHMIYKPDSTGSEPTLVSSPLPPQQYQPSVQIPHYLWLIEHDTHATDETLATLKSLYVVDGRLKNTSYDRASYAELALGDVFRNKGHYQAVLEADLIFCERPGSGSTPASPLLECRVIGNSYFSWEANRLQWPSLRTFDVATNFSLAFRPPFEGIHRVKPCMCQGVDTGTVDFIATAHKSAHRLTVECSKSVADEQRGPVSWEGEDVSKLTLSMGAAPADVMAPGFYVIQYQHVPDTHDIVVRYKIKLVDSTKKGEQSGRTVVPRVAARTLGSPRLREQHIICTLCRGMWAKCCRGYFRRYEAAILPPNPLQDLLATNPIPGVRPQDGSSDKPTEENTSGLFVALGMLAFFSIMASVGLAIRHILRQRRLSTMVAPAVNRRTWYVPFRQRAREIISSVDGPAKWLRNLFTKTDAQVSELSEAEKGKSPRKLQKKKGTRVENQTDPSVHTIRPASAMSVDGPLSTVGDNVTDPEGRLPCNVHQESFNQIDSAFTTQGQRSRTAATRRSKFRSDSQNEYAESA
ncbi:MAG: hypothetical protein Q9182_003160 [Xanthomendoza sp. 2 TL-2023]